MSVDLVPLAVLMFAVTYPSRAIPLLTPGLERLPPRALQYLRLVGPAVLASIGVVNTLIVTADDGTRRIHVGIETLAVILGVVVVVWRRNLFLGILGAVVIVSVARATGLSPMP
jgi:branched-subunit amino acid transport protein